ncbi:hypothetical protein L208DRAFT_1339701, partial [Tricholoma matsutake]
MTLPENTGSIPTQRKSNNAPTATDQTNKERTLNPTQTEKGRTTRRTGLLIPSNITLGDISDAEAGRSWLHSKGLIAPSGVTPTLTSLAETLFHIGALPNTPLQTLNGIRVVAFLLQELEWENTVVEVAKRVIKELTPFLDGIQNMLKEKAGEIIEKTRTSIEELGKITTDMNNTAQNEKAMVASYRDTLTKGLAAPPVRIDPRVRAKENIRARQFLWKLLEDTAGLKSLLAPQLLKQLGEKISRAAKTMNEECRLQSAIWLKNGGILIEASDNKSAAWLRKEENIFHMECELGTTIITETRNYNVMAYFVPLTFDTADNSHIEEVTENNGLTRESVSRCKWAKAPKQRNPKQMVGHMIVTFTDLDNANRAILNGLVICNKKVSVVKCKREPIRCLKCQAYNHIASECILQRDICAKCGKDH